TEKVTVTADPAAERTRARRALIGSGLLLAVAVAAANALNAVFQLSLARILDRGEYSLLAALFAVVLIGAVPPLAFQATTARRVAPAGGTRDRGRRLPAGNAALGPHVDGGAARAHGRPRSHRRRSRARRAACDRGDGCDRRDCARDPGRLGRPARRTPVPRPR